MAIRTEASKIRKILKVSNSVPSLDPFIETASNVVDTHCTASGYSDATLELIERWLSAHFVILYDRRRASEKIGPLSTSYESGDLGMGLKATAYGQQALILDHKGSLAALQKQLEGGASQFFMQHLGWEPV